MKFLLSFCIGILSITTACSIQTTTENSTQQENLYLLCKVWGFLKYHHPDVTSGQYDWDEELFKMLDLVEKESFQTELSEFLRPLNGSKSYPQLKPSTAEIKQLPNTAWIKDINFLSEEISQFLQKIEKAERQEKQHYVQVNEKKSRQPKFTNEKPYKNMKASNEKLRLLSLFRFWNMVEYFSPHRHLTDENWDNVLQKFIPRYLSIETKLDYQLTTLELIAHLQDSHSYTREYETQLTKFFGTNVIPLRLLFIEGRPIVDRVFEVSGSSLKVKKGDELIAIDGIPVDTIIQERIKYLAASNLTYRYQKMTGMLVRTNKSKIALTYSNQDGEHTEKIYTHVAKRNFFTAKAKPAHQLIGNDIGYINPVTLEKEDIGKVVNSFKDTKGIIFDLRGYPKFTLYEYGKYFMDKRYEFSEYTNFDIKRPGQFNIVRRIKIGKENPDYYKGKLVILIDENSISRSEFTAMAMRVAPNAVVVGSTTAGADGESSKVLLPGNILTSFTGNGVYNPDGTETQHVGIIPDVEVRRTIKGFRTGRDEALEKAAALIRK